MIVFLFVVKEREVRCPHCGFGEARDLLRIHPDGVNNSILYDPKSSAPLDRALGLKIRVRHASLTAHSTTQGLRVVVPLPKQTTCCSDHQEGRHFRVHLWIEDEHGVIIDPGGYIDCMIP